MRFLLLISTIFFCSMLGHSQTVVTWEDLELDSLTDPWSEKYESYYSKPVFSEKAQKLDGKKIVIKGFITPLDLSSDYYILSNEIYVPSCEVALKSEVLIDVRIKLDSTQILSKEITIKGVLCINKDDLHGLNYILKNPKIIEK